MSGAVLITFLLGVFLWMLGGIVPTPAALTLRICGVVAVGIALLLTVLPVLHVG